VGSIYGSHYRSSLPGSVDRLPTEAAESVRHSAAAGLHVADLHVADRLGARGPALADGVRSAFMEGLSASLITALLRAPKTPPTAG
jgi:hypothetical protein